MWDHFKQCYTQLVEKHVPFIHIKQGSRPKPPWVRYKAEQKPKSKRAKQVVATKNGLSADHIIYELEKEKLHTVLKEAKFGRPNEC